MLRIDEEEIYEEIRKQDSNKSAGGDGVYIRLLKLLVEDKDS